MELKGRRFLVIGGACLIGSHTVDERTRQDVGEIVIYDNFVRGPDNLAQALKDPRVKVYDNGGDICQTDILETAMDGVDCVFHLAELCLLQCHDFSLSTFDMNIRGTFNVLEACVKKKKLKRVAYSSSASVYGDAVREPMDEDHPFNNKNFDGVTKIADEAMAKAFHHRYGLPVVGLRHMNVYGPRQDYQGAYIAVIMKVLDAIDRGKANLCAKGAEIVDRLYNVGTGKCTSLKELAEMIVLLEAKPVLVDIEPDTCNIDASKIEAVVTPRTKAMMPVSLYGQPCDVHEINAVAAKHKLPVIEDAAQSFGATYKGRRSCNLSTIACTSFFPSKPLGCYGDGGALLTGDAALAKAMREIRVHGQSGRYQHTRIGVGGRMDFIQCAVVLAKLERFEWEIAQRQQIAARYSQLLLTANCQRCARIGQAPGRSTR